jgi:serine/threonine protein phosphatase 1
MRILAIGDIHGCLTALDTLLKLVQPARQDRIVTLGDYVDRGPNTRGVINRLIELHESGRLIALRGNHELMMLQARDGGHDDRRFWFGVGGREALASYGSRWRTGRFEDIPREHWWFIEKTCLDWYEIATHVFVHANLDPDLPLMHQPSSMLHWEVLNPWTPPHSSGKVMVCGHSEQRSGWPLNLGHALGIDTFAFGGGWLTCLNVLTGQIWQANECGETRIGWVDQDAPPVDGR